MLIPELPPIPSIDQMLQKPNMCAEALLSKLESNPTPADYVEALELLKEAGVQAETDTEVRLVKITRAYQSTFRRKLWKEQGGICPLCNKEIDLRIKGEGAIDHDHDTGRVRGLLHRSCNAAEGKVANAAGRWGAKSTKYADVVPFLERLVEYLKRPQSRYIYTYHKTEEELALEKKKRARATAATRRAKLRMQKEAQA